MLAGACVGIFAHCVSESVCFHLYSGMFTCVCVCAFIRCWLMTKIAESCSAGSTNRCHHTNTMVSMATVKIDSTFALRNSKGRCTNPREPPPPIITIPTDTDALKYQPHSEITSCHYIYKNIITAAYTNNLLKFKCTFCTSAPGQWRTLTSFV